MANVRFITFALTANFWKKSLYSVRTGSQPRNSTDLLSKTWRMNSTSELSFLSWALQKSSKNFLLLGWKKRTRKCLYQQNGLNASQ